MTMTMAGPDDKAIRDERVRHLYFDESLSSDEVGQRVGMPQSTVIYIIRDRLGLKPRTAQAGLRLRRGCKLPDVVMGRESVTAEQLKECRLDPAWEARHGITKHVVCRGCGALKFQLADGRHLKNEHDGLAAYRATYPSARLTNFSHGHGEKGRATIQERMKAFAAGFATAAELRECRRDPEWEDHHGVEEVVVCRMCGLKSKIELYHHLENRHRIAHDVYPAYHAQYPKAPTRPQKVKLYQREVQKAYQEKQRGNAKIGAEIGAEIRAKGGVGDDVDVHQFIELAKNGEKFKPAARGLAPLTRARIELAACLAAENLSEYAMTDQLNPGSRETFDKRRGVLKTFWEDHRERYQSEKLRIATLPKAERDAIAEGARAVIQNAARSRSARKSALSTGNHSLPA